MSKEAQVSVYWLEWCEQFFQEILVSESYGN